MSGLMFPKQNQKKRRKKHAKSILQDEDDQTCYLCVRLHGDYRIRPRHEHHICAGTANRAMSEQYGLKVKVCIAEHHEHGPEAPHVNADIARLLAAEAQAAFEGIHGHDKWMQVIGRNYL